jgi:hypothetical protein
MDQKVFLLNVGANCSHGSLRSPVFADGRFEFLPIPETQVDNCDTQIIPKYCDLFTEAMIPRSYLNRLAHSDPEFESFTYGDYPTRTPRVSVLRHAQKGDFLFFIARLVKYTDNGNYTSEAGFYLIGFFELLDIIKEVNHPLNEQEIAMFAKNAHVRRALIDPKWYDGFWLFKGSERSQRFWKAIPFDKRFWAIMRDRYGQAWVWKDSRSELQTIGSYTRSCRLIKDGAAVKFLTKVNEALHGGCNAIWP